MADLATFENNKLKLVLANSSLSNAQSRVLLFTGHVNNIIY